jgi:hypothetical protein
MGIKKCYRIIEATENCTFDDLHNELFLAFNREDEHLYSFFITRTDTQNIHTIYNAPEITHPQNVEDIMDFGKKRRSTAKTRIGDVDLNVKDVFYYLFDFGDDWWHRIRVENINELKSMNKTIKVIKSVGESPPQYPDYDDEDGY